MSSAQPSRGLRITGSLTRDAQLLYTPGDKPAAVLVLHVDAPVGLPYYVKQVLGDDPKVHIAAASKLPLMRRGAQVAVYALGLRAQSDHGAACLACLNVTDVMPLTAHRPIPQLHD